MVLAGGLRTYDRSTPPRERLDAATTARVLGASRLYQQHRFGLVILSGAPVAEGEAMEDLITTLGVPRERVAVESASTSTRENAERSLEILRERGFDTIVVTTSATHLRRALREFERAGAQVIPAAVEVIGPSRFFYDELLPSSSALYPLPPDAPRAPRVREALRPTGVRRPPTPRIESSSERAPRAHRDTAVVVTQPGSTSGDLPLREGGFTHQARREVPCVLQAPSRTRQRPQQNRGPAPTIDEFCRFCDAARLGQPFTTKLAMCTRRDGDAFPAYRGQGPRERGATASKLDVASRSLFQTWPRICNGEGRRAYGSICLETTLSHHDAGRGRSRRVRPGLHGNRATPEIDNPIQVSAKPSAAISGGTLTITSRDIAVAADPDRDLVWLVDLNTSAVSQVALKDGDEPGRVVEDGNGRVHVALRRGGAVATIDLTSGQVIDRTAVCAAPAASPSTRSRTTSTSRAPAASS